MQGRGTCSTTHTGRFRRGRWALITSKTCFEIGDRETAEKLAEALLPEVESARSKASRTAIYVDGTLLCMEIEAISIAALRALLNSYIRWISTSLSVVSLKGD